MTASPRRVLAAVLATAVGAAVLAALPAQAHNTRDTPKSAPTMDVEVMLTPQIEGRITAGGKDRMVAVDGFGNRFAVARKEDAQTAVGVARSSRTLTRAPAWPWTSRGRRPRLDPPRRGPSRHGARRALRHVLRRTMRRWRR